MIAYLVPGMLSLAALASTSFSQCSVLYELEPGTATGNPTHLTAGWGNTLFFTGRHALGPELFRWDPVNGAGLLKDIAQGPVGSSPESLTVCCTRFGPRLFFSASDSSHGRELWISDGTPAGTQMVKDIQPGRLASTPYYMAAVDDRVFFAADDGTHGIELWVSDGTPAGTTMVKDIFPMSAGSHPAYLIALEERVIFSANDPGIGRRIFVSDGTPAGTMPLWPTSPGPTMLDSPTVFGSRLFFGGYDPVAGDELWATDGTPSGTVLIADLVPGGTSSRPTGLCEYRGELYFSAASYGVVRELFKTDGTMAGTVQVTNLNGGLAPGSTPQNLTSANGLLFFTAHPRATTTHGRELHVTDGTAAGTRLAADINPMGSSFPSDLVPTGNGVCFRAEGPNGQELWFSDGTAAGTFEVCDIDPGTSSADPTDLTLCHGRLLFSATTPATGRELHWLPTPGATQTRLGQGSLPDRPTLQIVDERTPVQGSSIDLLGHGPSNHLGILYLGLSVSGPPLPGLMQAGCDWIGLLTPNKVPLTSTAQNQIGVTLAVPTQPYFFGVALHLQAWWLNLAAGTPLVQVSNGVQMVLGGDRPQ